MQQTNTAAQDGTVYNSIFFAEKFTNGPYQIQNPGDQIKVTLNVSLDWLYICLLYTSDAADE